MLFSQRLIIVLVVASAAFGQNNNEKKHENNKEKQNEVRDEELYNCAIKHAAICAAGSAATFGGFVMSGLNLIGFSSLGPVAGSLAASAQAYIGGNAVAGVIFSALQSTAMIGVSAIATPVMTVATASASYCIYKACILDEKTSDEQKYDI